MDIDHIVVVGGSVAGLSAIEALRGDGYSGRLTLVGEEHHSPYDRPPLSKQVLSGKWPEDRISLRSSKEYASLDLDFKMGRTAVGLDQARRAVKLDDGQELAYDKLIIATGVRARKLPFGHNLQGVHTLRTLDDCRQLNAELLEYQKVVVVGAGFLGTEVAATARGLGRQVTMVYPESLPISGLGLIVGKRLADLHHQNGVRLRFNSKPISFQSAGQRVSEVSLDTGEALPADLVVVAIGSSPAVDWLSNSGLTLDDGVVCDKFLRAAEHIYAIGDVAKWYHPCLRAHLRVEHRMNAVEQGISVAQDLLRGEVEFKAIPFFWTDQYELKIQGYGCFPPNAVVKIVDGDPNSAAFVTAYEDKGRLVGVLGWNAFKQLARWRTLLKESFEQPLPVT